MGDAVRNQISMLVAYSEMTTYCLVNKLIATGGALLALNPIPRQLVKFTIEQKAVLAKLAGDEHAADDLQYVHLLYPDYQCFKSADYPDILLAAIEKERINQGAEKSTIKDYKAKTHNATLSAAYVRAIAKEITVEGNASIDAQTQKDLEDLGFKPKELIERANKIMKRIARIKGDDGYESD
ncbi:hypothetical protein O0L34_g3618 [Tuta absoluta]|nr:hypothetical protein O0L34_g3618 [Tuta absoluta]